MRQINFFYLVKFANTMLVSLPSGGRLLLKRWWGLDDCSEPACLCCASISTGKHEKKIIVRNTPTKYETSFISSNVSWMLWVGIVNYYLQTIGGTCAEDLNSEAIKQRRDVPYDDWMIVVLWIILKMLAFFFYWFKAFAILRMSHKPDCLSRRLRGVKLEKHFS